MRLIPSSTCHDIALLLMSLWIKPLGKMKKCLKEANCSEILLLLPWALVFPWDPWLRSCFHKAVIQGPLELTDLNYLHWASDWDLIIHRHWILTWNSLSHSDRVQMVAGRSRKSKHISGPKKGWEISVRKDALEHTQPRVWIHCSFHFHHCQRGTSWQWK